MTALRNWHDERRSIYLYAIAAALESAPPQQTMFAALARAAARQADIWAGEIARAGGTVPLRYEPDLRTRIVGALLRRFGVRPLRAVLAAMKVRGMAVFAHLGGGHAMPRTLADVGNRHAGTAKAGNLRAAVFGVNDGLLSNASLMMGVAGAAAEPRLVVLAGVAGLFAGAISMACGEYVSVRSQRDLYEDQIGLERAELDAYPAEEAAELALIYEARGLDKEAAIRFAAATVADPQQAMDTLTRYELGLNPDELGSPWGAALSSFLAFALGAAVPLLPFLTGQRAATPAIAMALTAAALFAVGAAVSLFTGHGAIKGGLRMLAIGIAATGATYWVGTAIGTVNW
ncbi:MAG: VIT1/CCC1 transporter family protein [Rhodocyclales bacterium]|nr:VIT1/CCC1 transporter family protein [Rhodocyclales bacterium]